MASTASADSARPSVPPWLVLLFAVAGISAAAPLVRLSSAHPVTIGAWRLGLALIAVAVALAVTGSWREWRRLSRLDLLTAVGAGVMLALHFWSWNASVGLTTVAASVVLVSMQPAFVAVLSATWLRERPQRWQLVGIAIAMVGAIVVAAPDLQSAGSGRRALLGDALALLGAVTAALYYVAGRRLRQSLGLWPYVGLVYGTCFVTLLGIALVIGAPLLPQPPREWAIFAALATGPMLLGHTGMNWALKYLPAYTVNLTVLGEPVGATLLAAVLPGIREVPRWTVFVGGAFVLVGAILSARAAPRQISR